MEGLYLGIAAGIGGIVSGFLGWQASHEPFNPHKFFPTFLRSAGAGLGVAFASPLVEMGFWPGITGAFLAGAGVDVALHRIAGTINHKEG